MGIIRHFATEHGSAWVYTCATRCTEHFLRTSAAEGFVGVGGAWPQAQQQQGEGLFLVRGDGTLRRVSPTERIAFGCCGARDPRVPWLD